METQQENVHRTVEAEMGVTGRREGAEKVES